MAKLLNSLQTKLIASFILLILIVAGGTFFYTYSETKHAMVEASQDEMLQVIGVISQQFTPQEVQALYQLEPGQENSSQFLALVQKMQTMRAVSPEVINIYAMRIDNGNVTFLVDDLYPESDSALIGQQYEEPEPRLFDALRGDVRVALQAIVLRQRLEDACRVRILRGHLPMTPRGQLQVRSSQPVEILGIVRL